MSDLNSIEKRKLERALGMETGYVLNFSDRTFAEFFKEFFGVDIYNEKYNRASGSKANRMRTFWEREPNHVVGEVLRLLFDEWKEFAGPDAAPPPEECRKIERRLMEGRLVSAADSVTNRGSVRSSGVPVAPSSHSLVHRLKVVLTATGASKGKALESFISEIFSNQPGLRVIKRNARLSAEEIDLVIQNDLHTGFWNVAGSPVIVECKNWSGKVGASEISVLVSNLQALGPDAKGGILVAVNGITGDSTRDAALKIREARQRGRYVVVLECHELETLARGELLAEVIQRKYQELLVI